MSAAAEASIALSVSGMTCASCAAHVRRALEETPGVREAAVDVLLGRATERVTQLGHDRLSVFGIGTNLPPSNFTRWACSFVTCPL